MDTVWRFLSLNMLKLACHAHGICTGCSNSTQHPAIYNLLSGAFTKIPYVRQLNTGIYVLRQRNASLIQTIVFTLDMCAMVVVGKDGTSNTFMVFQSTLEDLIQSGSFKRGTAVVASYPMYPVLLKC